MLVNIELFHIGLRRLLRRIHYYFCIHKSVLKLGVGCEKLLPEVSRVLDILEQRDVDRMLRKMREVYRSVLFHPIMVFVQW